MKQGYNELENNQGSLNQDDYILYSKRYLMTFLMSLAMASTSILFPSLNPIAQDLSKIYNIDHQIINSVSLIYLLMHPLFTYQANNILDKQGLRKSVVFGSVLAMIGAWMRVFININFIFVFFGMLLAGIARPFIINAQGKIAANWYAPPSRNSVTSILSFIMTLSIIFGVAIPGILFKGYNIQNDQHYNYKEGKIIMERALFLEAILITIMLIPTILWLKDKPPTPPSYDSTLQREDPKTAIKCIVKNSNYLLLWVIFGIFFGSLNSICVSLSQLLEPYGFNQSDISIISSAPIISGLLGVVVVNLIKKYCCQYKLTLMMLILFTIAVIVVIGYILKMESIKWAVFGSFLFGFSTIPAHPILIEFAVEVSFPVGEGTVVGLLYAGWQIWSFIIGETISAVVSGENKQDNYIAGIIYFGLYGFTFFLCLYVKEDLRRSASEKLKFLENKLCGENNNIHTEVELTSKEKHGKMSSGQIVEL